MLPISDTFSINACRKQTSVLTRFLERCEGWQILPVRIHGGVHDPRRVVVGVKDDATRHKLLQVRDFTLRKAIDICKASESAGQQLRAMTAQEHVQALQPSQTVRSRRSRPTASTPSKVSLNRCKYCGRTHEPRRELCPAYGQTCHRCPKNRTLELYASLHVHGPRVANPRSVS